MRVIDGAVDGLLKLAEKYDLYIVTARGASPLYRETVIAATEFWLQNNFPPSLANNLLKKIIYSGSMKKSEVCKSIRAHAIIDDSPRNILDCRPHVAKSLLFNFNGNYPWSMIEEISHFSYSHAPDVVCCQYFDQVNFNKLFSKQSV